MARLKQKGLQSIDGQGALRLFQDPRYEQELVVFVDARGESHYLEGHIPGALQFDRYYPEKYLPAVVAACISAQKVVVYCTGGDCEDSEFAALALKDAGVPAGLLVIYAGGMTDWTAKGWITEIGARKSGNLRGAKEQIRK